jgi:DNA recombination protein RmuC
MTKLFISLLIFNSLLLLGILIAVLIKSSNRQLTRLTAFFEVFQRTHSKNWQMFNDELGKNRDEGLKQTQYNREEINNNLRNYNDIVIKQIDNLSQGNEYRLDKMRETIETKLFMLQEDNNKKLEEIRITVDEKLHSTIEKRLGESFKFVSERLEQVHKGLGEMQTLAIGVGDLKKVLSNVKTRGTWGELQLGNLLEQILTADQYSQNVKTKAGSDDHVEFAVKLPGSSNKLEDCIWLPIDAKFPQDTYQKLINAQESAKQNLIAEASKQLEQTIKLEAKSISTKYLDPPNTTDFAVLFLPIEGLYAEVLRLPDLHNQLLRDYRVLVAGPGTFAAFLNSLQMGFRTLAIEKRTSEVWSVLGAVKTEFGRFGDILEKTQKKLQEAGNTIESAAQKSRSIERKLRTVQDIPSNNKEIANNSNQLP